LGTTRALCRPESVSKTTSDLMASRDRTTCVIRAHGKQVRAAGHCTRSAWGNSPLGAGPRRRRRSRVAGGTPMLRQADREYAQSPSSRVSLRTPSIGVGDPTEHAPHYGR